MDKRREQLLKSIMEKMEQIENTHMLECFEGMADSILHEEAWNRKYAPRTDQE